MSERMIPSIPSATTQLAATIPLELPRSYVEPRWYAAHTCSRHEKRIADQLQQRDINHYLPLYQDEHRWKDRLARVDLPLFPGYIFVHIPLREKLRVLELPGIVRLVSFSGEPAPLPESEIEILRQGLTTSLKAEPHPYLKIGKRVRVKAGPLAGLEGILTRKKDNFRLVLSIDLIMRSVSVEVSSADIDVID